MTTSETVKYKFDCPFDLEAIFKVTVDTNNLRGILEFILERLASHDAANKKQDARIADLDMKLVQRLMQVDK